MFGRFRVQSKIVLPYTLLFAAVIAAMSLLTIIIVHRQMDERIEGQMQHMADAISNMAFLLSRDAYLSLIRIKEVVGADIIAYGPDGAVTVTTLDRDKAKAAMAVIRSPDVEAALSRTDNTSFIRNVHYLNSPHKVIYRRLKAADTGEDVTLSLIASTAGIALAKRRFRMSIGLVAISGILLVAVLGSVIARSITAPVKQLVEVTEQIAAGDLKAEATVKTRDEIGALASSINEMTGELQRSRDRLVQSEKLAAVGQLAAGIAHEIRNPLTSVKMIVQLLKRRLQDDEAGLESVQAVLDEINRLEVIINGLLDFARPMELDLRTASVADVMNDVLKFMEADLRHRKIKLVNQTDMMPPESMLDTDRIKQVFMNVILNSMQAMPEGGELAINYHYDAESHRAQVEVSDTGNGMSQEVLTRVFEPFFSTKTGGTGLGLANVRKIMEQHGGDIQIESTEGQGTKVIVSIEVTS